MNMRTSRRWMILSVLALIVTACSTSASTDETVDNTPTSANRTVAIPWSASEPPSFWASGLTLSFIPDGFTFDINAGHESATFHDFTSTDGLGKFSVGRAVNPEPLAGEQVTRDGRVFTIVEYSRETRIREEVGNGFIIEVVGRSLDTDTLLRIADGMSYDPTRDRCTVADDCS